MGWIVLLWVVEIIVIGLLVWGAIHFGYGMDKKPVLSYISAMLAFALLVSGIFATGQLTNTESFKRFQKSMDSEFKGGVTREITVYSEGGVEIYKTKGKFDVEHREDRLKWVDENGMVQIVYLGRSSTAVVNEIK